MFSSISPVKLDLSDLKMVILKRGSAWKKQSRLHNYVAVTLVLTPTSLMYFHEGAHPKPACTIPLSAVISSEIVTEPSISIYHGISQYCSFLVSIGDRVFKFRVDTSATAATWSDMIMDAKEEQILEAGENNPLVITNTAGDNTDGTKFWRTAPVGYVENFNAAMNTISSALPTVSGGSKSMKDKDTSGLSRKQIEALLTFETLICLDGTIALRVANAFFDCCASRSRSTMHDRVVTEDSNNICRLLGHSIAHWLIHSGPSSTILGSDKTDETTLMSQSDDGPLGHIIPPPTRQRSGSLSSGTCGFISPPSVLSPRGRGDSGHILHIPHTPSKTLILQHWIESCVLHEFHKFSSRQVTDFGTLRHGKMPFRSRSITGLFLSSLVRSVATKSSLLSKWLNPALLMIANTPASSTVLNQDSDNPSLQLPIRNLSQGGRLRSDTEESDLGDFFKDVVACHKNRSTSYSDDILDVLVNNTYYSPNKQSDSDKIRGMFQSPILGKPGKQDEEEVEANCICFPRKVKPGGLYFQEDKPALINMRSHIFVRDGTEVDDPLLRLHSSRSDISRCVERDARDDRMGGFDRNMRETRLDSSERSGVSGVSDISERAVDGSDRSDIEESKQGYDREERKEGYESTESAIRAERDGKFPRTERIERDDRNQRVIRLETDRIVRNDRDDWDEKEEKDERDEKAEKAERKAQRLRRCSSERYELPPINDPTRANLMGQISRASFDDAVVPVRPARQLSMGWKDRWKDGWKEGMGWKDGGSEVGDFLSDFNHMEGRKYSCDDMPPELTRRSNSELDTLERGKKSSRSVRRVRSMSNTSVVSPSNSSMRESSSPAKLSRESSGNNNGGITSNVNNNSYNNNTSPHMSRNMSNNMLYNPIEQEVEMEKMICTLIIDRMTRHKDEVPKALEILFKSIRDICHTRNESGIDTKATGKNVYYSCCSALLVTQLISPALLAPVKWNLALPSFLLGKSDSRTSSEKDFSPLDNNTPSRGMSKQSSITVVEGDKSTFGSVSPLYVDNDELNMGSINNNHNNSMKMSYHNNYHNNNQSYDHSDNRDIRRSFDMRGSIDKDSTRDNIRDNISEAIRIANESKISMASRFSKLLSGNSDSHLNLTTHTTHNTHTTNTTNTTHGTHLSHLSSRTQLKSRSASTGMLNLRGLRRVDSIYGRNDGEDQETFRSHMNHVSGGGNGWGSSSSSLGDKNNTDKEKEKKVRKKSFTRSFTAPKKIPLSETLMHAAISLIVIAQMLGGEGKNMDNFMFVWGGQKERGMEMFQAARTLINTVPLTKAYELAESLRKTSKADIHNMCGSSESGFTSDGEMRALHGLSRTLNRLADQSCLPIPEKDEKKVEAGRSPKMERNSPNKERNSPMAGVSNDRNKALIEPLCLFFEDIGGGEVLHSDD